MPEGDRSLPIPEWLLQLKKVTPARVLVGRAGPAYRTQTYLDLKADHAAARDAVQAELSLARDFPPGFLAEHRLFEVCSRATSKREYLLRPDLGRQLSPEGIERIKDECEPRADLQIFIGDGLSATAVATQVPALLPMLNDQARRAGWRVGRPFVVRYCRVGLLNDVGETLHPQVAVLLIGERPGLLTAESLSAYMAYSPKAGDTDAKRNLISNIYARGVSHDEACRRILSLADQMRRQQISGVTIKEEFTDRELPGSPIPQISTPEAS
ncbi:ethanolamine ammonia-lyase subunit EutC [bacterium]|nr:ethanolamine ammonia-lyase subunit EutC [bacterium]